MTPAKVEPSDSSLIQPFYPSLDGLRAIAFFLVFTFHCSPHNEKLNRWSPASWGWTGVELFFVLSGFLITGIVYDSRHRSDRFRSFYVRRTLRIFPLFYGFWLITLLITPWLHVRWNRYVLSMALYLGNWFIPGAHMGLHADPGHIVFLSPLRSHAPKLLNVEHLWSLCVEEQFYLVWPAVVWSLGSRRVLLWFCVFVLLTLPAGRFLYLHSYPAMLAAAGMYFPTPVHLDALLCGAGVALWLRGTTIRRSLIRRFGYVACLSSVFLMICSVCFRPGVPFSGEDRIVVTAGYSLIAICATGLLVLCLDQETFLASALSHPWLAKVGRLTYGLYFFHVMILSLLPEHLPPSLARSPRWLLVLLLTFALAQLSFRFWESPFLRLKDVLAPGPRGASSRPSAVLFAESSRNSPTF